MNIISTLNDNLSAIFDIDDDPLYKSLICDQDGTIPTTITKPTDIDIGAIASQIEYLRRLSIDLITQMRVDLAEGDFLEYTLEEFFASLRAESETDAAWVQRTIDLVLQPKVSWASLIIALRPYSSVEPVIQRNVTQSAFADFSYADIYVADEVIFGGETVFVLPAIAEEDQSSYFSIKVILWDTLSSDYYNVTNLLDAIIAAGISYTVQINYT